MNPQEPAACIAALHPANIVQLISTTLDDTFSHNCIAYLPPAHDDAPSSPIHVALWHLFRSGKLGDDDEKLSLELLLWASKYAATFRDVAPHVDSAELTGRLVVALNRASRRLVEAIEAPGSEIKRRRNRGKLAQLWERCFAKLLVVEAANGERSAVHPSVVLQLATERSTGVGDWPPVLNALIAMLHASATYSQACLLLDHIYLLQEVNVMESDAFVAGLFAIKEGKIPLGWQMRLMESSVVAPLEPAQCAAMLGVRSVG